MTSGDYLVLSYILIGWGLNVSNGMYDVKAYALMVAGLVSLVMGIALMHLHKNTKNTLPSPALLTLGLLSFCFLNIIAASPGLYIHSPTYEWFWWITNVSVLLSIPILCIPVFWIAKIRSFIFLGIALIAIAFRLALPFASPEPNIDVFSMSQQSSQHLLNGKNPYVVHIRDVYEGMGQLGYVMRHYTYPPASLYPQAIAYALTHDVRYAMTLAEVFFLFVLWWMARKHWLPVLIELLILLFLFHPRGIFVLEQAWTEPLLLGSLALFAFLWAQNKRLGALISFGYFLSIKQYTIFFALPFLILERRWRQLSIVVLMITLTLLPFALWHWESLLRQGLLFQFTPPFRDDSLSLSSFVLPWIGELSKSWSAIVGGVIALLTSFLFRKNGLSGFLQSITLTSGCMFVLGSWSFANYYSFLSGLILLTLVHSRHTRYSS